MGLALEVRILNHWGLLRITAANLHFTVEMLCTQPMCRLEKPRQPNGDAGRGERGCPWGDSERGDVDRGDGDWGSQMGQTEGGHSPDKHPAPLPGSQHTACPQ